MSTTLKDDVEQICDLVARKIRDNTRILIGIAGPPAAGKSTLAQAVVQSLNTQRRGEVPYAALLAMDGYHLDNRVLEARGLLARKGAPETFNARGFCQDVRQLALPGGDGFYPTFDRELDLAIANAVAISAETPVVIVEGNYLLLDSEPWRNLRDVFAASVFICPSIETLRERLHQRWISHGFESKAALARSTENDLPNARLVIAQSLEADIRLTQSH